ncbi:MAG: hypothetical protein KME22_31065 [Hassallia sp. WJT32-NPBG1]|nr:hypothetical protein [Hassallia sp. WJT32-NPBG1]
MSKICTICHRALPNNAFPAISNLFSVNSTKRNYRSQIVSSTAGDRGGKG